MEGRGLNLTAAEFQDFSVQSDLGKQRRDCAPQATFGGLFLPDGIPQNVSYFFLHAPLLPLGTALQPRLNLSLDLANDDLRHHSAPLI